MERWVEDAELDELARGLREIDQGAVQSELGESCHWYQGGERYFDLLVDCDLSLTEDEDGIPMPCHTPRWMQLSLRGRVLTWERGGVVRSGRTDENEVRETHATPVRMVDGDATVDPRVFEVSVAILSRRSEDPVLAAVVVALRT